MIKSYLRSRWPLLVIAAWGVGIFTVVDAVTPKETSHIAYGIFLYLLVSLVCMIFDFAHYRRKALYLKVIADKKDVASGTLKPPEDVIDARYAEIFKSLQMQTNDALWQLTQNHNDQIEYYSMWVHQIKTPISALRLMVQSDDELTDKGAYYAELFRIEQYVEMVLQYLRLQNISEDMVVARTDVYTLVRDCVKKFSPIFINKHIAVDVQFFDQLVLTDEKWLAFMVEQILSNSLKYSSSGTIRFLGRHEADGWSLVIKDEGIGIRSEDIPRIFDKGYTGYNGRIYKKSTGIGLYLVDNAAKRLGINVEVASEVGVGTTVKIYFPKDFLEL